MTLHCMVDLETYDTLSTSVVLSLGACLFDPQTDRIVEGGIHIPVDQVEQLDKGRTTSQSTIAWWDRQSPEARASWDVPVEELYSPLDMLRSMTGMMLGADAIWSHGSIFDVAILEDMYRQYRVVPPWKFWDIRDTRTIYDLAKVNPDRATGTHHNALDDAIQQAKAVQQAYRVLGLAK